MGFYDVETQAPAHTWLGERPQLPYLIPFLVFVGIMAPGGYFGDMGGINWTKLWFEYLPVVYTVKTVVAAVLLAVLWKYYTPIKWGHWGLAITVGLAGVPLWVGLEYATQYAALARGIPYGPDYAKAYYIYDPVKQIPDPLWRYAFYFIRVAGPTLVVPVMEELFFRDFLQRALVRGVRFQEVAIGTFTWFSLLGMAALFGFNHIQWPSGIAYGLLMGLLLIRTKSLGACIVAHAVTNLVLYAGWCIPRGDWQFM